MTAAVHWPKAFRNKDWRDAWTIKICYQQLKQIVIPFNWSGFKTEWQRYRGISKHDIDLWHQEGARI